MQQKIRETGLSKNPFLRPFYPTSDPNAVGAGRRPARPGRRFLYVPRNPPGAGSLLPLETSDCQLMTICLRQMVSIGVRLSFSHTKIHSL